MHENPSLLDFVELYVTTEIIELLVFERNHFAQDFIEPSRDWCKKVFKI